eukprot:TRINITY_DN6034_c0_g1_i2.p1 TRINITY_DN6034_c0_g1~~TRINITY_DN6034_c0_g1_i2.p1  ORF type:complete len:154 (-),score=11.58 TRINITY_DN6034_c0_g1_i2:95-556(-)
MGTWVRLYYTPEQQQKYSIDEDGDPVSSDSAESDESPSPPRPRPRPRAGAEGLGPQISETHRKQIFDNYDDDNDELLSYSEVLFIVINIRSSSRIPFDWQELVHASYTRYSADATNGDLDLQKFGLWINEVRASGLPQEPSVAVVFPADRGSE